MKTLLYLFFGLVLLIGLGACENDLQEMQIDHQSNFLDAKNNSKMLGYDEWGFNFEAQHFKGYLINMILADPAFQTMPHYRNHLYTGQGQEFWDMLMNTYGYFDQIMPGFLLDCELRSKWNDGIMDKNGVYPQTWVDSNGIISFKYSMTDENGKRWSHFRKLVSSRSTDELVDGFWFNEDGQEIGFESYWWPTLIVVQVNNTGNPPSIFYNDYIAPYGQGYGHY